MGKTLAFTLALCTLTLGIAVVNAAAKAKAPGSPIYNVKLPDGYRDWKLISVAQENGMNNDIRAIVGNDIALQAFTDGTRPFPDGAIIVRLAWRYLSSPRIPRNSSGAAVAWLLVGFRFRS
jgi:hypothetical protein